MGRLAGDETAQTTRFSPSLCVWDDAHAMTTTARVLARRVALSMVIGALGIAPALGTTPTASVTATPSSCVGDCNGDGMVRINEIITGLNIALGNAPLSVCPASDCPQPLPGIFVNCAVEAVDNALNGCSVAPTRTPIGAITYRLEPYRGSWITEYLPQGVSVSRPLAGSFTVVPSGPVEGKQRFHFSIIDFAFDSVTQQIRGGSGEIEAPAPSGDGRVRMLAAVAIDGQDVVLQGDEPLSALADYPPSILFMEICGAPGAAITCDALHAFDHAGYSIIFSADPDVPQTPIPTPTVTPIVPVRYQLTEGSTLVVRPPTPGAPLSEPEALSGSFTMVRCASPPPNTLFLYTITDVDIRSSAGRSISGASVGPVWCASDAGTGSLQALTFSPGISLYAVLSVDGDVVGFNGGASGDGLTDPPLLQGLEACGVSDTRSVSCADIQDGRDHGYDLVIFARPDE